MQSSITASTSGTTAIDSSGNGRNGAIVGAPTLSAGGIPYEVLGPVAPLFCTYYSGVVAKLRTPAEFTESGVCPAGVTMGWYT